VGGDAGVLEQVGQPSPAVGRLKGHLAGPGLELAEDTQEVRRRTGDAVLPDDPAEVVDADQVGASSMQVDANRYHVQGPPLPGCSLCRESVLSLNRGGGRPPSSWHHLKHPWHWSVRRTVVRAGVAIVAARRNALRRRGVLLAQSS
jgi:hypothetical protein